jgi:hypothetical protein
MHMMIRQYRTDKGSVDDLMHKIDTEFADDLQSKLGIVSYQAVQTGEREVWTITTFRDSAALEQAQGPAEAVRSRLAEFAVNQLSAASGEILVMRSSAAAQSTIHH